MRGNYLMKNTANVLASFYLLFNTDLSLEEFQNKLTPENVIHSKIVITLPDGSVHNASFADLLESKVVEFEDNKKATDGEISEQ